MSLEDQEMGTRYEQDVVAWANEQVALLRAGKFSAIDVEHMQHGSIWCGAKRY
jgi:Domain of unknown function DUF29